MLQRSKSSFSKKQGKVQGVIYLTTLRKMSSFHNIYKFNFVLKSLLY